MHARRPGGTYAATLGNNALLGVAETTRTTQGCKADNEFACGGGYQTRQEMWVSMAAMQWENFSAAAQSGDGEGCGGGGRAVARLGRWWAHDWEEEMERSGEWMAYGPHADRRRLWTMSTSPQTVPKFGAKMGGLSLSANHGQRLVEGGWTQFWAKQCLCGLKLIHGSNLGASLGDALTYWCSACPRLNRKPFNFLRVTILPCILLGSRKGFFPKQTRVGISNSAYLCVILVYHHELVFQFINIRMLTVPTTLFYNLNNQLIELQ
jgi:hypothetical protein